VAKSIRTSIQCIRWCQLYGPNPIRLDLEEVERTASLENDYTCCSSFCGNSSNAQVPAVRNFVKVFDRDVALTKEVWERTQKTSHFEIASNSS